MHLFWQSNVFVNNIQLVYTSGNMNIYSVTALLCMIIGFPLGKKHRVFSIKND